MKGYRTIIFNVVMSALAILAVMNPNVELPEAQTVVNTLEQLEAAILAVWGIGNVILRAVTTTPIFKKE